MAKLKATYEALGFKRVRTYLQSGNAVFDAKKADPLTHTAAIEKRIAKDFGFDVSIVVKTTEVWSKITAANPFLHLKGVDPKFMLATIFSNPSARTTLDDLTLPAGDHEEVQLVGEVIYLCAPNGYGKTKLTNQYFEKIFGVPATTRNWNTMLALEQMAKE